jgi:hypothetical protein
MLVIFSACLASCEKQADREERMLNVTLHHCVDNIFSDNAVSLCFDSIISDSRCPSNAMCVWQGAATARFTFTNHNETHVLQLSTINAGSDFRKDTVVAGYKIEFLDLSPYPGLPPATPPNNEIRAKVKITRL